MIITYLLDRQKHHSPLTTSPVRDTSTRQGAAVPKHRKEAEPTAAKDFLKATWSRVTSRTFFLSGSQVGDLCFRLG